MKSTQNKLIFSTVALAVSHGVGVIFNFYETVFWYDILTHFLGGIWAGSIILWFVPKYFPNSKLNNLLKRNRFLGILISILIVTLLWEAFEFSVAFASEYLYDIKPNIQPGIGDTITDILLGILGALLIAI